MMTEFIRDKRLGHSQSHESLLEFIEAYSKDRVPDYQVAAWLMAVCLKGLNPDETLSLTQAMVQSGEQLNWPSQNGFLPTDKHSTGGVGDKTSLIIAPLVASFGIPVPMMAGRGLGFTGGTLDKLESIPGFQTRLSMAQIRRQMDHLGFFLVGQTDEICPADKRMYSLRDVTSTVDSIPLICASILSKKMAEGAKSLVMDVKVGSGAFMTSLEEARSLAHSLIQIGKIGDLKVSALITDMNQPLGRFVGNALEVKECLDILIGEESQDEFKSYKDTKDLSVELSAQMLFVSGYSKEISDCRKACLEHLENGRAYEEFERLVYAQGGDLAKFKVKPSMTLEVAAPREGYFHVESNKDIGFASLLLGGGRQKSSDQIDPDVGLEVLRTEGDLVPVGSPVFKIHFKDQNKLSLALKTLEKAYTLSNSPPKNFPLIHEHIPS